MSTPRAIRTVRLREPYRIPGGAAYTKDEVVALPVEDAVWLVEQEKAVFEDPTPVVAIGVGDTSGPKIGESIKGDKRKP